MYGTPLDTDQSVLINIKRCPHFSVLIREVPLYIHDRNINMHCFLKKSYQLGLVTSESIIVPGIGLLSCPLLSEKNRALILFLTTTQANLGLSKEIDKELLHTHNTEWRRVITYSQV